MTRQVWAITTCRVSSPEQLLGGSLDRQAEAVLKAAEELNAFIPEDGQWSGNVSSKAGTNTKRKDLDQMLKYCKRHPQVKYLIVHEVDRFMRSMKELFYFEVEFEKFGVKVWYASQPELNVDDADYKAKLFKAFEAFKGEGSNAERIKKSIDIQEEALKHGKYYFSPKPGYMKGSVPGIPELHPVRGPILRGVLIRIATRRVTPTQALKELNDSDFMKGHSVYKMDKFSKIATDPFNAGILDINKQVKVRNENGLHEALITPKQLSEIIRIFTGKPKYQSGPRKNGNPKYGANNITVCDNCLNESNGRFVGFDHTNGKSNKIYERYRCRSCGRYLTRQEMHEGIKKQFKQNPVTKEGRKDFIEALEIVWKQRKAQAEQEATRLRLKINALNEAIEKQVDELTDTDSTSLKERIRQSISKKEGEIETLGEQLANLTSRADDDWKKFLRFAFEFVEHMGDTFLETSQENRLRCKQIVFPAGFYVNENKKVYTPEISPIITLLPIKKSTEVLEKSHLVRVRGL